MVSARLEVEDVTRRYGDVEALRGLTLAVEPGELMAVLGASGSGKSTLLRVIAGLEAADEGRVLIDGDDQTKVAPARRGVAMVFQSFALFPHLSVERNIAFGLQARGEDDVVARVRSTASALRLERLLDRRPSELSGGERQRVALARALAGRPRVLMLDEPLSNLDAPLRVSTRAEIRRVQERSGVTTLHVTHDQAEALALGHRVAVLRDGRLEQVGTPDEVWERPASVAVARFLGTPPMNLVPAPLARAAGLPGSDGTGVLIGFRAEDVACAVDPASPLRLEAAERLGADRLWHLAGGGERVIVRAPGHVAPPAPGTALGLRAAPEKLRRFAMNTGKAVG